MISQVDHVFDGFPNLIHVAGHEHGLQFIKGQQVQVISGAGAKHTFAKKGRHSLFADATQGFVTVDQLAGKDTRITYYTWSKKGVTTAFVYTQPYTVALVKEDTFKGAGIRTDSIIIRANPAYDRVGRFHRKLFGENFSQGMGGGDPTSRYQDSPELGGLIPCKRGGGMQLDLLWVVADKMTAGNGDP